jgi:hypothetical protein
MIAIIIGSLRGGQTITGYLSLGIVDPEPGLTREVSTYDPVNLYTAIGKRPLIVPHPCAT